MIQSGLHNFTLKKGGSIIL